MTYQTEQEAFWAGKFGNEYIDRNNDAELIAANLALFSRIFQTTNSINSVIEFGANIGLNLQAIKQLLPNADLSAIEINANAVDVLKKKQGLTVYHSSILDFEPNRTRDFVYIKGVLIHINPDVLQTVYEKLYQTSNQYICLAEYYNPTPVEIDYRGHSEKLFKRDFAGELMDKYPDLKLVDYGFAYHRDQNFTHGDSTWFLLEKTK
jgi:spore coat polysaccharide biosynthesis protein SpsF